MSGTKKHVYVQALCIVALEVLARALFLHFAGADKKVEGQKDSASDTWEKLCLHYLHCFCRTLKRITPRTNCTNVQVDCFCKKIKRRQPGARRAVRGAADEEQENVQSKVFLLEWHCLTSMSWHKGIWGNMDVSAQGQSLQGTPLAVFALHEKKWKHVMVIALNFQALVALLLSALEIRSYHCLQVSRSSRLFWISPTTSWSD